MHVCHFFHGLQFFEWVEFLSGGVARAMKKNKYCTSLASSFCHDVIYAQKLASVAFLFCTFFHWSSSHSCKKMLVKIMCNNKRWKKVFPCYCFLQSPANKRISSHSTYFSNAMHTCVHCFLFFPIYIFVSGSRKTEMNERMNKKARRYHWPGFLTLDARTNILDRQK